MTIEKLEPRYEYRIFADDLAELAAGLVASGELVAEERSDETYLVSRITMDANVKIRDGRLDVKSLVAREGLAELWRPTLSAELPVDARQFSDQAAAVLGFDIDIPSGSLLDAEAITSIAERQPSLIAVAISKHRVRYELDGFFGEVCTVAVADRVYQSVAIESTQIEAVESGIASLGLASYPNESYPAFLQRVLYR